MGVPTPTGTAHAAAPVPLAMAEIISPIMAAKHGFGLAVPPPGTARAAALNAATLGRAGTNGTTPLAVDVVPSGWDPIQAHLSQRLRQGRLATAITPPPGPTRCASQPSH